MKSGNQRHQDRVARGRPALDDVPQVRLRAMDWADEGAAAGALKDGDPGYSGLLDEITTPTSIDALLAVHKRTVGRQPEWSIDIRSKEGAYVAMELRRRGLSRREAEDAVLQVMRVSLSAIDKYYEKARASSTDRDRTYIARFRAVKERNNYTKARNALSRRQQVAWEAMRDGAESVLPPRRRRKRHM